MNDELKKIKQVSILLLDDDLSFLQFLSDFLTKNGFITCPCLNLSQAISALSNNPSYAIVDLFLNGSMKDSSLFISEHLKPKGIPFGRLSSAPRLIKEVYAGNWVLHKQKFLNEPSIILDLLKKP